MKFDKQDIEAFLIGMIVGILVTAAIFALVAGGYYIAHLKY